MIYALVAVGSFIAGAALFGWLCYEVGVDEGRGPRQIFIEDGGAWENGTKA